MRLLSSVLQDKEKLGKEGLGRQLWKEQKWSTAGVRAQKRERTSHVEENKMEEMQYVYDTCK